MRNKQLEKVIVCASVYQKGNEEKAEPPQVLILRFS